MEGLQTVNKEREAATKWNAPKANAHRDPNCLNRVQGLGEKGSERLIRLRWGGFYTGFDNKRILQASMLQSKISIPESWLASSQPIHCFATSPSHHWRVPA